MSVTKTSKRWLLLAATLCGLGSEPGRAFSQSQDNLMPYAMLRSLQFVQDSVAMGDHSASEMQRFLLQTIDERLKSAPSAIFKDPRNVDAALIYAMSGGNPATLELLVARDVDGNFDSRVADILRKYLSGKGTLVAQSIAAMVPEYRGKRIGAYLALIGGNVTIPRDPVAALGFYDIARLEAPGTIVEEAALRRSLAIAVEDGDAARGVDYAQRYARRFLHSPYASQFADLLVSLVVKRADSINEEAIQETFAMMDMERQKEAYLRLSRLAAISGRDSLARMAALKAKALSPALPGEPEVQANLYESLSNIGTPDVVSAIETIGQIPEAQLSDRDRALREAARAIAEQVVRPPSLQPGVEAETATKDTGRNAPENETTAADAKSIWRVETQKVDDEGENVRQLVTSGRSKLDEIDSLLKKGEGAP
ncbi:MULTISPECIES: chemotaxis protein MotC [unclassified Agrobacterium]|uniref:chemotaxis protein MotC n=1 Tax=unclassified Agrobacterium TaxID=2632611 RepID=UPI002449C013|nr:MULTISPECIES: chemotaxis protein MotC [unclassified Agrobacterium]MDH0613189.1 chemotaxis protein MotC [Agrobacterium sp. GD03872]MDH0695054.1 chemotaxis protein MotC [Agrobacterium sp. GD03871]MDH1057548.1 chemotaxis protein MotC [Agrobacterium sp. GD03992]MDH2208837.1 chemotaxis protein MotC [Agrobacterium sp. GD03643]MDH2218328.1 chemotaxis protein MotC [Agrobacterium sp. GD03638]